MNEQMRRRLLAAGACSVALIGVIPATAAAADAGAGNTAESQALGNHQRNVRLDIGVRTQFIKTNAFDPFSERDALTQFTTNASIAFPVQGKLSVAAVLGFDYGGTSARFRSDDAELDVTRFLVAPEARYHLLRVLVLTAKVGPTLTRERATLSGGLGTDLSKTAWCFGFDATAGAAVELWGYASGANRKPRLWAAAEGGYGYAAGNQLTLKARDANDAPQRLAALDLGNLALGGPLFRITAGLSFW